MHHPTDRIKHTTVFGTPVVEHWLETISNAITLEYRFVFLIFIVFFKKLYLLFK